MLFAEYLRAERKKLGLSAEELAKRCGTSRSYITLMESGKRLTGKNVIMKIAMGLNLSSSVVINWYLEDVKEKLEKKSAKA